jgi:hypothetical protein
MGPLADLHRAIAATLAGKRLGKPVFVRYLFHGTEDAQAIVPRLVQLTAVVREWLGQSLERIHATGSTASGQVALTLQFREGASALVCFAHDRPHGSGVDVTVLGNHGALYHDAGSANLWPEEPEAPPQPEPILEKVIAQALRSGKPEKL